MIFERSFGKTRVTHFFDDLQSLSLLDQNANATNMGLSPVDSLLFQSHICSGVARVMGNFLAYVVSEHTAKNFELRAFEVYHQKYPICS